MSHPDLLSDRTAVAPLAVEGRNCWRRAVADRVALLVDAEAYFAALKAALLRARRSILIIGWDFDSRTELDRAPGAFRPNTIGGVLNYVVRHRRGLRAQVLIWDTALIYSWDREFLTWAKFRWLTSHRLDYRLDNNHPLGACHHQKIVVIDDRLAFIGGLDVSSGRWDTREHRPDDPRRSDALVSGYAPFHDMMLMLSGDAAAALGEVARQRWHSATGRWPQPAPSVADSDPWPPAVPPLMRHVMVAIARTLPAWEGESAVREVERLYLDMIGAAHRFLLLENQYFASRSLTRALLGRLRAEQPPDVAVVSCQEPVAMLERTTMGAGRALVAARLRRGDRADRLRLYTPDIAGTEVKIHSKLAIVDDAMLRVGSANLNNRSMGLDTECDVLIEALGNPEVAAAIRRVRCDLLAEHLGVTPEQVDQATARLGLIDGIESLRGGRRSLVPVTDSSADMTVMADLFDPDGPVEAALVDGTEVDIDGAAPGWLDPGTLALAALLLAGGVVALAWQVLPQPMAQLMAPLRPLLDGLATMPHGALVVVAGMVVGGLLDLPVTALLIGCGALFGLWGGFVVGLAGALASALVGFALGRLAGRDRVRSLVGRGMPRVVRALPRRGIMVVALLRLVPVASCTVINLVAGAAPMRLANYLLGTVMGMTPVVGAMALFGDRLTAVARRGSLFDLAVLCLLTVTIVLIEGSLARRLARGAAAGSERGSGRV